MADIFISYKSEDRTHAERLAKALEKKGHSVWWDTNLEAGKKFRATIASELKRSSVVVVIWTTRSVESTWVIDEADFASQSKKLLPVMIRSDANGNLRTPDIPLGFRQIHAEDLTDWDGESTHLGFSKVLDSISNIKNNRWNLLFRVGGGIARSDAARFFSNINTDVGGLPIAALFMGALGLSLLGAAVAWVGQALYGNGDALTVVFLLPIWLVLVVIARGLHQFATVTSGKSSRHFFDDSFTLVFFFCVMISCIVSSLLMFITGAQDFRNLLVLTPSGTLALLLVIGLLRSSLTGLSLLFSKL